MVRSQTIALLVAATLPAVTGCDPGKAEREAMRAEIKALQQENAELRRQLTALQKPTPPGHADAPLAGLADLLGLLGSGNFKIRTGPPAHSGRAAPMDPELQKRIDRLFVDGIEKLSKNKDAKDLLKALMGTMARDLQRQSGIRPGKPGTAARPRPNRYQPRKPEATD